MATGSAACYPDDLTDDEWEAIVNDPAYDPRGDGGQLDLGPGGGPFGDFSAGRIWHSPGNSTPLQDADRAEPAAINYSFSSELNGIFSSQTPGLDFGRELSRQAMAAWSRWSGVRIVAEVADAGNETCGVSDSPYRPFANAPDVRWCGGGALGTGYFPASGGNILVTSNPQDSPWTDQTNSYRYWRALCAHEFGHAIGMYHFNPQVGTNIMTSPLNRETEVLSEHEKRALGRAYGDRFAPNYSRAEAWDFGLLADPSFSQSVIEQDLSTNLILTACRAANRTDGGNPDQGIAGSGLVVSEPPCVDGADARNPGDDWFTFTLDIPSRIAVTVNPTGGEYWWSPYQRSGPQLPTVLERARIAGRLGAYLYRFENGQYTFITGALASTRGWNTEFSVPAAPSDPLLPAGRYYLLVRDWWGAPEIHVVQLYDLMIRVNEGKAPPRAVAGIPKRVQRDTDCYFFGDVLSRPTEPGTAITRYDWSFDGDMSPDAEGARVCHRFSTTGRKTVWLFVTDSYGTIGKDSIIVDVHD